MVAVGAEEGLAGILGDVPEDGRGVGESLGESQDDEADSRDGDGHPEAPTPLAVRREVACDHEGAE